MTAQLVNLRRRGWAAGCRRADEFDAVNDRSQPKFGDCTYCGCPDTLIIDDANNALRRVVNAICFVIGAPSMLSIRRRCSRCLLVFTASYSQLMGKRPDQSRCPKCGYDATQHRSSHCPECGFLLVHKLNDEPPSK